jgi:tRNA 2-selenouridine synthase
LKCLHFLSLALKLFLSSIFAGNMPAERITIGQFLQMATDTPVFDVRSPAEYLHAHFPGAFNLPLFTDEERKVVGTLYKQSGKKDAIRAGLNFFGPKMNVLVEQVESVLEQWTEKDGGSNGKEKQLIVHCWRGGMRSAGIAWLLDLYGFRVYTLAGGYKSFRRWCIQQFEKPYPIQILGGYTGSGKTEILRSLKNKGQEVIDLERIAFHKGSVFGNLGEPPQPSQEMFENRLALALASVSGKETVWLEDESQRIGDINIPIRLYRYMQTRPLYFVEIPFEERLQYITEQYGKFGKEILATRITRIQKRLGGLETKTALEQLERGELTESFRILLKYYDKFYLKSLQNKLHLVKEVRKLECLNPDPVANAEKILRHLEFEFID